MDWIGPEMVLPPNEPWNRAPNEKMPPSAATSR